MANNESPYEILAAPFTLWLASVGVSFPVVDAAPSASWTKLGTSGALDYGEGGVSIKHSQVITKFRGLGSTLYRKAFRTEEELIVKVTIHDLTLEQYKIALNGNAITTTAASSGVAGNKAINLERGLTVTQYALLVRGISPYGDYVGQFELPTVIQTGEPEVVFDKGNPAGLELSFEILKHASANPTLRMQTAAAS